MSRTYVKYFGTFVISIPMVEGYHMVEGKPVHVLYDEEHEEYYGVFRSREDFAAIGKAQYPDMWK